jgi:hypothetical protein
LLVETTYLGPQVGGEAWVTFHHPGERVYLSGGTRRYDPGDYGREGLLAPEAMIESASFHLSGSLVRLRKDDYHRRIDLSLGSSDLVMMFGDAEPSRLESRFSRDARFSLLRWRRSPLPKLIRNSEILTNHQKARLLEQVPRYESDPTETAEYVTTVDGKAAVSIKPAKWSDLEITIAQHLLEGQPLVLPSFTLTPDQNVKLPPIELSILYRDIESYDWPPVAK